MAENETLTVDNSTVSRWKGIQQQISSGKSVSECLGDLEKQLYRSLRSVSNRWAKRGVSLERMLDTAMNRPSDLEDLVRQVGNHDHARLLFDITRHQAFLSLEQLLSTWLGRVWESIRDQLQLDLANPPPGSEFEASISEILARLARLMARNPSRVPHLPRRPKQQTEDRENIMNRSLLPQEVTC